MNGLIDYLNLLQNAGDKPPEQEQEQQEERPIPVEVPIEDFVNAHYTVVERFQPEKVHGGIPQATTEFKHSEKHTKRPKVVMSTVDSIRRILRKQFFAVARPLSTEHNLGDTSADVSRQYDVSLSFLLILCFLLFTSDGPGVLWKSHFRNTSRNEVSSCLHTN